MPRLARVLVVVLLVLGVLLGVADRVLVRVAQNGVADRLQQRASLAGRPAVTIHGVPFLTQLVAGRYGDVEVAATGVDTAHFHDLAVHAHLRGVQVPFSGVVSGRVSELPVDVVDGVVSLPYDQVAGAAGIPGLAMSVDTRSVADGRVLITGRVTVLGRDYTASARASTAVRDGLLTIDAEQVTILGTDVPAAVRSVVARGLSFVVRLPALPFGLRVVSVRPTRTGLDVTATARDVVLRSS